MLGRNKSMAWSDKGPATSAGDKRERSSSGDKSSEELARSAAQLLVSIISVVSLVMTVWLVRFFLNSPIFSSALGLVVALLYNYLSDASSFWHKTQQLENQFWMLTSLLISVTLLFAPDSPFEIHDWQPVVSLGISSTTLGIVLVVLNVTLVHYVDKNHHRKSLIVSHKLGGLGRTPSSLQLNRMDTRQAEEKLRLLQTLIEELDYLLPSSFHNMLNLNKVVQREKKVYEALWDCSKDELNYIVLHIEMRLLVYKVKDHSKESREGRSRSDILELLSRERVSDLSTAARVIVLDTIQGLRLTTHPQIGLAAEKWIENIVLKTRGDALSDLKSLMDNKGSVLSMHKLVYEDVQSPEIRENILAHIRKQAAIQQAHMSMGTSIAKRRLERSAWRKVISDVDDTLLSSGGRYPAGIDKTYPHHCIYPGAICFYKELDFGNHPIVDECNGIWPPQRHGNMVFLSARPHVYKDMVEKSVYHKFEKLVNAKTLHAMPTLLPGDVESGQAFMLRGDFEPMAKKKLRNFMEYASVYPEFTHVFIGDNGQADVKAAEYMVDAFGREVVTAVYIHRVQSERLTYGYKESSLQDWKDKGIIFFDSFIHAAVHAAEHGLIRMRGLRRVAIAAKDDFERISWKSADASEPKRLELNNGLAKANALLKANSEAPVALLPAICEHPVGTEVYTRYGKGFVQGFRPLDGIYCVVLDWTYLCSTREEAHSIDSHDETGAEVSSMPSHLHRAPTLLYVARDGLRRSRKELYKSSRAKYPQHYPGVGHDAAIKSGDEVHTPFGPGVVLRFRSHDAVYELKLLGFPAKAYVDSRSVRLVGPTNVSMIKTFSFSTRFASIMSRLTISRTDSTGLVTGQSVHTKFGTGIVVRARADMIIEVNLDSWQGILFVHISDLDAGTSTSPEIQSDVIKKESALVSLLKKFTASTPRTKHRDVKTPYGHGRLVEVRENDNVHVVELEWGGQLFALAHIVSPSENPEPQSSSLRGRLRSLISIPSFGMTGKALKAVSPKYSDLLGAIGDEIATPFGTGVIIGWRNANVVVVQLSFGTAYIPITEVQGQEKEAHDVVLGGYFTDGDGDHTDSKQKGKITRPRSLSESYETIKYLTTTKLFGLFFPERGIFKKSERVWTALGPAEVIKFRRKDRIYELLMLEFKAFAFCSQDQVFAEAKQIVEIEKETVVLIDEVCGGIPTDEVPAGHTRFSWNGSGHIPPGHTGFSWRESL